MNQEIRSNLCTHQNRYLEVARMVIALLAYSWVIIFFLTQWGARSLRKSVIDKVDLLCYNQQLKFELSNIFVSLFACLFLVENMP